MFEKISCQHEYHVTYESSKYSLFDLFFISIFHLSCIHCGKGICHKERIRYHGSDSFRPATLIREMYSKPILTRLYAKYNIINKLTKL